MEERVAKIESDLDHIRLDVAEVKGDNKSLRAEVHEFRIESHTFRTEVTKEFGLVREEIAESRTETAKEFGLLRASIERMKLWGVVAIFGAALATSGALPPMFSAFWHAVKSL